MYEQTGKDLRYLKAIVGTGGALIHSGYPKRVLHAATDRANSRQLLPEDPALFFGSGLCVTDDGTFVRALSGCGVRSYEKALTCALAVMESVLY